VWSSRKTFRSDGGGTVDAFTEAEPVRLPVVVIRILAEQEHPHAVVGREPKRREDLVLGGKDRAGAPRLRDEGRERTEVGLLKLRSEHGVPRRRQGPHEVILPSFRELKRVQEVTRR
jgi:hypothetical protein